jgi:lysozyme
MTDTFNRAQLEKDLTRDESSGKPQLQAYFDTVGKCTIGVGRNLDGVGLSVAECQFIGKDLAAVKKDGITYGDALMLLGHDIDRTIADLDKHWPWWRSMNGPRQRVIANLCFNMGAATLGQFVNTLKAMKEQRWHDAAAGMLKSKWAGQVGDRAVRLAKTMELGR